jgi:hypothetical protein
MVIDTGSRRPAAMMLRHTSLLLLVAGILCAAPLAADDETDPGLASLKTNNLTSFRIARITVESYEGEGGDSSSGESGIDPWAYITFRLPVGGCRLSAVFEDMDREWVMEKEMELVSGTQSSWEIREDDPSFIQALSGGGSDDPEVYDTPDEGEVQPDGDLPTEDDGSMEEEDGGDSGN